MASRSGFAPRLLGHDVVDECCDRQFGPHTADVTGQREKVLPVDLDQVCRCHRVRERWGSPECLERGDPGRDATGSGVVKSGSPRMRRRTERHHGHLHTRRKVPGCSGVFDTGRRDEVHSTAGAQRRQPGPREAAARVRHAAMREVRRKEHEFRYHVRPTTQPKTGGPMESIPSAGGHLWRRA